MEDPIEHSVAPTADGRYQLAAQDLARGEALRLTVTSGSMEPLLRPGDVVLAQPVGDTPLAPGDIIVVQWGNAWVTHRVWQVSAFHCFTAGDNSRIPDEPVALADVVGRVVSLERGNRRLDLRSARWQRAGHVLAVVGCGQLNVLKPGRSREIAGAPLINAWRKATAALAVWPFRMFNRLVVWIMLKLD